MTNYKFQIANYKLRIEEMPQYIDAISYDNLQFVIWNLQFI